MSIVHENETMRAADHASPAPAEGEQKRSTTVSLDAADEAGEGDPRDRSLVEEEAGYGYGV